jgi:hypothetical protein
MLGIALAATGSFSFEERKERLNMQNADMPLKRQSTEQWPWLLGSIAVIGGVTVFLFKANKKT